MNIRRSKCCVIQESAREYARVCFCLFIIYSLARCLSDTCHDCTFGEGQLAEPLCSLPSWSTCQCFLWHSQVTSGWLHGALAAFSFASVLCTLVNTLWNPARCSCNRGSQCPPVWMSRWVLITVHCACVESGMLRIVQWLPLTTASILIPNLIALLMKDGGPWLSFIFSSLFSVTNSDRSEIVFLLQLYSVLHIEGCVNFSCPNEKIILGAELTCNCPVWLPTTAALRREADLCGGLGMLVGSAWW